MNQYCNELTLFKEYFCNEAEHEAVAIDDMKEPLIEAVLKATGNVLDKDDLLGVIFFKKHLNNPLAAKHYLIITRAKIYDIKSDNIINKIWFDEIQSVEEYKDSLLFTVNDEEKRKIKGLGEDLPDVYSFVSEMVQAYNARFVCDSDLSLEETVYPSDGDLDAEIQLNNENTPKIEGAGLQFANKQSVNKAADEQRFLGRQGHGFAAERANNLNDRLRGKNAKVIGDNNAKDGPDRIVNGVYIQSKYCKTGYSCVRQCFRDGGKGEFKYYGKNGKPMLIEVPNDQEIYDSAVKAMRKKIINGQVPGVSNPDDALNIIKRGDITYKQAVNIAKAGTVESLVYDSKYASVTSVSAFGISAAVSFAVCLWKNDPIDVAFKNAAYTGLKVGGTSFVVSVVTSQAVKAGFTNYLKPVSEAVVKKMGPKASAYLVNAYRTESNIFGATAMNRAAKILRNDMISAGATFVVLEAGDVYKIFTGRISGKQMLKNAANTGSGVLGGYGGFIGGAAAGTVVAPGVGTAVGGIVGAFGGAAGLQKVLGSLLNRFVDDDAVEMIEIISGVFPNLAEEYLLNNYEMEKVIDKLGLILNNKELQNMFSKKDREKYAEDIILPLIEEQVNKRPVVFLPDPDQLIDTAVEIMETMPDDMEEVPE